jgi:Uncharacterized protein conserved in bacteria (DUF2252)
VESVHIVTAAKEFEAWVGSQISVVRDQLSDKHKMMARDPVQFLRGTFYRWAQSFPTICPDLAKSTVVLGVGDLHIASFGTWRDGFGRLIWGVDDFDEAYPLPYTNDLVRLAVSAVLDASEGAITVGVRNVCDVVLEGYREGLEMGGRPFVLEENHKWLRGIALDRLDIPADFWKKMSALPTVKSKIPGDARKALETLLPRPLIPYRVVRRIAGIGSLGHPRYVALTEWKGGKIALEAKAETPSACAWARGDRNKTIHYQTILERAVRCADPYVRLCGKWLVRQLAPDSSPIEIESMRGASNQDRLLHAMAWEAANIHLGSAQARTRILAYVKKSSGKWLRTAVRDMAKTTIDDWKAWKKARR